MDDKQCKPSFFTIIKEGHNSNIQHMRVPPKFLEYLDKDLLSNDGTLVCPYGDQWQVTLTKRGNDIYMYHGWPQFLRENKVMLGDFLVFAYDGKNCFQVQIFRTSGIDRPYYRKGRMMELKKGKGRMLETETPMVRTKKGVQIQTKAGSSLLEESKPSPDELALGNKGSLPKDNHSVPQVSPKTETSNDCNLVESFTTNNPCFKHLMKKTNVEKGCFLNVAAEFSRKHLPPAIKEITLQNSLGKCWEIGVANYCSKNRSYYRFSKGWSTFASNNKLKIGDTCIFELEGGNNMRVHIFRCAPN